MFRRTVLVLCCTTVFCLIASAGKNFSMPEAKPAASYPAHDYHPDEKVTVALDPYDMADKASIFSVRYSDIGFMPIFLVITNDGDETITLRDLDMKLVTVDRSKISPATEDDLYRRLSHPTRSTTPSPLPFPRGKVKGTVNKKTQDEIQNAQFMARAVEPHSTQAGFIFFDVSGISTPLAGAHFYLSGVLNSKGNELMYFEIPLEKYLSAPAR